MPSDQRRDGLLIAIALTEFSYHYEQADPELSRRAWQLAADCLLEHDIGPVEALNELKVSG